MMEEESSERMFRIILLSNQKKNKSVSCFSCLQTYYTRSGVYLKEEKEKKTNQKEEILENTDGDTTQPGADLTLLDDPKLRKEYLDCMKYLLTQITDFGFQQEEEIGRSIISHTKYRLKDRDSIIAKMIKKKRELTEENVFTYINDLAGIRVVCLFLDDIYRVRDFIYQIPGISIVKEKDFVKKPKNSGYQSLHIIVQFTNGKKVEIQLRTIGMDFWSVLEYQLQYKKHHKKGKMLKKELFSCAIDVRNMDQRMLDLRQSIENV